MPSLSECTQLASKLYTPISLYAVLCFCCCRSMFCMQHYSRNATLLCGDIFESFSRFANEFSNTMRMFAWRFKSVRIQFGMANIECMQKQRENIIFSLQYTTLVLCLRSRVLLNIFLECFNPIKTEMKIQSISNISLMILHQRDFPYFFFFAPTVF
jgi:hypothetical protein